MPRRPGQRGKQREIFLFSSYELTKYAECTSCSAPLLVLWARLQLVAGTGRAGALIRT